MHLYFTVFSPVIQQNTYIYAYTGQSNWPAVLVVLFENDIDVHVERALALIYYSTKEGGKSIYVLMYL